MPSCFFDKFFKKMRYIVDFRNYFFLIILVDWAIL